MSDQTTTTVGAWAFDVEHHQGEEPSGRYEHWTWELIDPSGHVHLDGTDTDDPSGRLTRIAAALAAPAEEGAATVARSGGPATTSTVPPLARPAPAPAEPGATEVDEWVSDWPHDEPPAALLTEDQENRIIDACCRVLRCEPDDLDGDTSNEELIVLAVERAALAASPAPADEGQASLAVRNDRARVATATAQAISAAAPPAAVPEERDEGATFVAVRGAGLIASLEAEGRTLYARAEDLEHHPTYRNDVTPRSRIVDVYCACGWHAADESSRQKLVEQHAAHVLAARPAPVTAAPTEKEG